MVWGVKRALYFALSGDGGRAPCSYLFEFSNGYPVWRHAGRKDVFLTGGCVDLERDSYKITGKMFMKKLIKKYMPIQLYKKVVNVYFWLDRYFHFKFLPEGYKAFDFIYKENYWEKGSGHGSSPEVTLEYRTLLEKIITEYNIKTIVDFGCGDWQFSKYMNWHDAKYVGYDVVKDVIEKNIERYAKSDVRFFHLSSEDMANIEAADLYIAKEVFQHLPNAEVQKLLHIALARYKYLLITNAMPSSLEGGRTLNKDVAFGFFRCLDVTMPPFSLEAHFSRILKIVSPYGDVIWKVVLVKGTPIKNLII
jgi:SAM-dependent methyltransferase